MRRMGILAISTIFVASVCLSIVTALAESGDAGLSTTKPSNPASQPASLPAASAEEIKKLIAQLGDKDYKLREAATKQLEDVGDDALPAIEEALNKKDADPETQVRLNLVKDRLIKLLGPKCSFYGSSGNANEIVYVIDRSGAMILTFDFLRREMLVSIGQLNKEQAFHVIFYGLKAPLEVEVKQLVAANRKNKVKALELLKDVTPEGQTDVVPALKRAFEELKKTDKKGKMIFLLTDGVFLDNNAVLKLIKEQNPPGKNQIMINTFLYDDRNKEAEEVMQKIAKENKGRYKFINPEEDGSQSSGGLIDLGDD